MFALHNVDPRDLHRTSLDDNFKFLPRTRDDPMEGAAKTGLRRRSIPSNRRKPRTLSPTRTASAEEIDPLDSPPPPTTTLRRRRSTGFRHFESKERSGILRWLLGQLLFFINIMTWVFKIFLLAIFLIFVVALFNALPLEIRVKTARNFFKIATGWKSLTDHDGWLAKAASEWVMGMMVFERTLLECLAGRRDQCHLV